MRKMAVNVNHILKVKTIDIRTTHTRVFFDHIHANTFTHFVPTLPFFQRFQYPVTFAAGYWKALKTMGALAQNR